MARVTAPSPFDTPPQALDDNIPAARVRCPDVVATNVGTGLYKQQPYGSADNPVTPAQFIAKWQNNVLSERAGAQSHFLDLCELLGVDKPSDPDTYCFERGARRTGAGNGWADVWKRDHFAWEYKAPGANLGKALKQLMTYALALDNPPLLVVSDRLVIHIHTHFTGTPPKSIRFP